MPKTRSLKLMLKFIVLCTSSSNRSIANGGLDLLGALIPMVSSIGHSGDPSGSNTNSNNVKIISNIFEDYLRSMGGFSSILVCSSLHNNLLLPRSLSSLWRCVPTGGRGAKILLESLGGQHSERDMDFVRELYWIVDNVPEERRRQRRGDDHTQSTVAEVVVKAVMEICREGGQSQKHQGTSVEVRCFSLNFLARLVTIFKGEMLAEEEEEEEDDDDNDCAVISMPPLLLPQGE